MQQQQNSKELLLLFWQKMETLHLAQLLLQVSYPDGRNFPVSTMVLFQKILIILESQDTEPGVIQVNLKLLLIPGVQK